MRYAYVADIVDPNDQRSNSKLYKLINQLDLPEGNVFIDSDLANRPELAKLLEMVETGDTIIIRSIMDLSESLTDIYHNSFPRLQDQGIELFSCEEPFFCGSDYSTTLNKIILIIKHFRIEKQKNGFDQALAEGRVGRPAKDDGAITEAIRLYETGVLTIAQIEKLTGVSKSTLYRYLKNNKEDDQK